MSVDQFIDSLDLNDYLFVTNKIRFEILRKRISFVFQEQFRLGNEWNPLEGEFQLETLLVNRLGESESFLVIYLKASPDDLVAFV